MFDISSNHSLRNYNKRTFCKTSNVNLLCYKANTISKIKMSLLRIHLISILVVTIFYRTVQSQSTMVPTCGMNNTTDTECILRQVSEQVAHLSAKIDGLQECQAPLNNQNDHATDHVLNTDSFPENCKDIYDLGHVASGVYMIYEPITQSSQFRTLFRGINVYCDMEDFFGGPGWLVFQRRQDDSVSFDRNWNEYADGFGDLNGNFWIGNDNLALITSGDTIYELRIELQDWDNEWRYARYASFRVEDASTEYVLRLGSFTLGDAGDSMTYNNGSPFTTPDNDNDQTHHHCGTLYGRSGWWFNSCSYAFLNNPYSHHSTVDTFGGIVWSDWHGRQYSLKRVEMKLRPV